MSEYVDSVYLANDLYGRIAYARSAYAIADENRDRFGNDPVFGSIGGQFCRMVSEYIGDMTSDDWDEQSRFDISDDLYRAAWEHYPDYAPLLDGNRFE